MNSRSRVVGGWLFGLLGEDVGVGGLGGIGLIGYVDRGYQRESDGRQADFVAASLVMKFQGHVVITGRGSGKSGQRYADDYGIGIDVEGLVFGKAERFQSALGIDDVARFETGGDFGAKIGGDQIVCGNLAGVDVEAGANFQDDGDLEGFATGHGIERDEGLRGDDIFSGRGLGTCQVRDQQAENHE